MKKAKRPFIVNIAVFTVLTTIIWTGFDVYRRFTIKPVSDVPAEILDPVDPTLNQEVLARIQSSIHLEEGELSDTLIISIPQGTTEPAETPEASPSSEEATEEATSEPEINEPET